MLTTVLLVDDDPDDQYLFNNALQVADKSISLSIAKDGVNAFEKLLVVKPDLIFLDLNMPRMNGWEFLTRIKQLENFNSIPVIIYSTYASAEDRKKSVSLGARDCIEKPVLFDDTVEVIRKVLSGFNLKN